MYASPFSGVGGRFMLGTHVTKQALPTPDISLDGASCPEQCSTN